MLHFISQLTIAPQLAERIGAGDDVLLQQGAVWAAWAGHCDNAVLVDILERAQIYVLQDLLTINGIPASQLLSGVQIIAYPGLVELTVKNPLIHTWS